MTEQIRRILEKKDEEFLFMERQLERFEALTKKRMELIRVVMNTQPQSINKLADSLHRDVKNVFDDLKLLDNMKIVRLVRVGRCVRPVVRKKFIIISLE